MRLNTTEKALDLLASEGYDPDMGARPLRRVIQQKIEDRLSDALLSKEFIDGDTILIDANDDKEIVLKREDVQPETAWNTRIKKPWRPAGAFRGQTAK